VSLTEYFVMQEIHGLVVGWWETSTPADGENRSVEVREPTPPPQTEAIVEPMLQEATLVEGKCPVTTGSHHV
jgi:hypothetical protein